MTDGDCGEWAWSRRENGLEYWLLVFEGREETFDDIWKMIVDLSVFW